MVSDEERTARYEAMWEASELLGITGMFSDTLIVAGSNDTLAISSTARSARS